jgi:NADH:ubiquinone oxidoreductase subunit F (NADH-binding)/(2Fe-2S) ferredoxin/Pyruvate/2-oxoacid:ferredoxin oxidoreductase delta subunit
LEQQMSGSVSEHYQELLEEAESELKASRALEKIRIHVGSATCEDAAGAVEVREEFRRHIQSSGRDDILLSETGCTGRCSLEPIVSVRMPDRMPVMYSSVTRDMVHRIFTEHILGGEPVREQTLEKRSPKQRYQVLVCGKERRGHHVEGDVHSIFEEVRNAKGLDEEDIAVFSGNCLGFHSIQHEQHSVRILIRPDYILYRLPSQDAASVRKDIEEIVEKHLINGNPVERLIVNDEPISQGFFKLYADVAFFRRQSRIALRNAGILHPERFLQYVRFGGFKALAAALEKDDPEWVVQEMLASNLRGRGGGGFPTGLKWSFARKNEETTRYIICNADEGDPGAFMDRSMLESDPFSIVEGMIIGGYATGACKGFFYIRAEYPLAIKRIENAIEKCREAGLLGENIFGSGFSFDLEVRLGAGAFVCGEETALIHSIEGERGQPRIRPPFPTNVGLWGKPTVINNVETFANVPAIINYGSEWFKGIGTEKSGGTKVFALAGKVKHTGLVEVPMGTTLREVVFGIGGGVPGGKKIKAVQTGGPAGGLIPAADLDTPVDYDTLAALGSIMGSGGMIVLDEDDCVVDVAKFFMAFCQDESCGKCTPCREGTRRMLEILDRITKGQGTLEDIENLERLAKLVQKSSLCGLGRAAPNPVISTLKHFRDEYEAHVVRGECPARKCTALIRYEIDPEKCVGCTLCAKKCPVQCISGERKQPHVIDQERCIKCGLCFENCRFDAITRS